MANQENEIVLAIRPDKKHQRQLVKQLRRETPGLSKEGALAQLTHTLHRDSTESKQPLTAAEIAWAAQQAEKLDMDVSKLELMIGRVNDSGTQVENPKDLPDSTWRRQVKRQIEADKARAHIAENGAQPHHTFEARLKTVTGLGEKIGLPMATLTSIAGLKDVSKLGTLAFREHYEGPKLDVKERDYPQLVQDVKHELAKRLQPNATQPQKEDTDPMSNVAKEVVDRAMIRAQARLEDYTKNAKHGFGIFPFQGALRRAWFHREQFDAEHHHLNLAAELVLEEVLGEGDLRSALKAVNKLVGTKGWDGKTKRSLLGAFDDAIGIIPGVPEWAVEKLDEKIDEKAVIRWAAKHPEKFLEQMASIEVARELTRVRHENHYEILGSIAAKLLTGGSKS